MQVLGGRAHRHGRGIDEPLGDEARVEVDVVAHRVVAHVLDTAREDDLGRAHRDLARARGDGGERSRAHAVDREPRDALRQPGEQRDVSTERQALVADLRSRRHDDVVDPFRGRLGLRRSSSRTTLTPMSSARVRQKTPLGPGPPERRADAVDEVHLAQLTHAEDPSQSSRSRHGPVTHPRVGLDTIVAGRRLACA